MAGRGRRGRRTVPWRDSLRYVIRCLVDSGIGKPSINTVKNNLSKLGVGWSYEREMWDYNTEEFIDGWRFTTDVESWYFTNKQMNSAIYKECDNVANKSIKPTSLARQT